jgi:uncharacterized protein (TIGR03086 family)
MPEATNGRGLVALHRRAVQEFGTRVRSVGDDQWRLATPCSEWDVHDLVNHLVNENLWTTPLLEGNTVDQVGNRFDGDLLVEHPVGAWDGASREAVATVAGEGVLGRTVHVSFGDISGEEYVSQLTTDHVIHAWDLARATGGAEQLPPELVDFVHGYLESNVESVRASGVFGEPVDPPPDADRQTLLLAMAGRTV